MQNLKYPVKKLFLNGIDLKKIKMYTDSADGRFTLHFLDSGVSIKGQAAISPTETTPTGTTRKPGVAYLAKTITSWGQPSSYLLDFDNTFLEGGLVLTMLEKVERPGFDNSKNNRESKVFTGKVENATASSGLFTTAVMEAMKKQILADIEAAFIDRGNIDYMLSDAYSPTIARKVVGLSACTTSTVFTINVGKTKTIAQATDAVKYSITAGTSVQKTNAWGAADSTTGITVTEAEAIAMGVDVATNTHYSVSAGTAGSGASFEFVAGKDYTFFPLAALPEANKSKDLIARAFVANTATAFALGKYVSPYKMSNLGGVYHIISTQDFEYFTAAATSINTTTLLWVRSDSTYVQIEPYANDVNLVVKTFLFGVTGGLANTDNLLNLTTIEGEVPTSNGVGSYPVLTARQIAEHYRAFGVSDCIFDTALSGNFPVSSLKYIKYEIGSSLPDLNLHGASHTDGYTQRVEVIVPYTAATTNAWDSPSSSYDVFKADAATSAAKTFDDVMAYLTGTATTSWK